MLKVFITFDYELFLGENFKSEYDVLFKPTEQILDCLIKENSVSTFFADIYSLVAYNKYKLNDYVTQFSNQIQYMVKNGQDVQLHIHPNWLNSIYDGRRWFIDYKSYKLHCFNERIDDIVYDGKNLLERIIREVSPQYSCIAYRAGGFCIQPEYEILSALSKNKILIDSSVAMFQQGANGINDYDFTNIPNKLGWHFDCTQGVCSENPRGSFFEVPVGAVKNNIFRMASVLPGRLRVTPDHSRGVGIKNPNIKPESHFLNILKRIKHWLYGYGILSLDTRGARLLKKDLDELYFKYQCDHNDAYVSIICHPKLASSDTVDNLREFIQLIKADDIRYSLTTFSKEAHHIEAEV